MRKLFLALALTGATASVAVPAIAAPDPTKPTGEKCAQRVQSSNLSEAGKSAATTACAERAKAVRESRATFRLARQAFRGEVKAARTAFRGAVKAAKGKPAAERRAAVKTARADRRTAVKSAREKLRAARKTNRENVKAANRSFREAMAKARTA